MVGTIAIVYTSPVPIWSKFRVSPICGRTFFMATKPEKHRKAHNVMQGVIAVCKCADIFCTVLPIRLKVSVFTHPDELKFWFKFCFRRKISFLTLTLTLIPKYLIPKVIIICKENCKDFIGAFTILYNSGVEDTMKISFFV